MATTAKMYYGTIPIVRAYFGDTLILEEAQPPALTGEAYNKEEVETLTGDVTIPATAQPGDLLIVAAEFLSSTALLTGPAGWTELGTHTRSACNAGVWSKVCEAGDPGSSVTVTSETAKVHNLAAWSFANVTSATVEGSTDQNSGSSTFTVPANTPAAGVIPAHVIAVFASSLDSPLALTPPSGMSIVADNLPQPGDGSRMGLMFAAATDWADNVDVGETWTMDGTNHTPVSFLLSLTPSSGGGEQPQADPTPGLFFEREDLTSTGDKKVFGHYFAPYPVSLPNSTRPAPADSDYFANNYLRTDGESGQHAAYGGFLRNRPMPRPDPGGDWMYADALMEIDQAIGGGLDGLYCNIMSLNGWHPERYGKLRDAAHADRPGFLVVPMVDANGSIGNESFATVASTIADYHGLNSTYYDDQGRMVVGSFKMEGQTPSWWQSVLNTLASNHGITATFVGVYNVWSQSSGYTGVQSASGPWGLAADPNSMANHGDYAGDARGRGELWQACVWPQNIRPRANWFDEAANTGALRAAWERAISDDADLVQLCTWSDYSEGSEYGVSAARGYAALDITAWYVHRWKTGSYPAVLADALYLSHRNQMASSTIVGPQTEFMTHRITGSSSPFSEKVEALVFLTAPATVEITVDGTTSQFNAPAGMSSHTVDAAAGNVSARVVRSAQTVTEVDSPVPIKASAWVQDRQYFMFSSLRPDITARQFDPQQTVTGATPTYP